jgi:streptogramin lyase
MFRFALVLALGLISTFAESSWTVTTIAGTGKPGFSRDATLALDALLNNPYGLCKGADGRLYFCDMENQVVRKIEHGYVSTIAGTGERGYSGDGGPASAAHLNEPYEVRVAASGAIFFVEMKNNTVRKIDAASSRISTVAGTGREGFSGDGGPAAKAALRQPHSIQLDHTGNLYICDIGNHRLRKVDALTQIITTLSGTGQKQLPPDGLSIRRASLFGPRALDFDSHGDIWLALREGNSIYKLDFKSDSVVRMAGTGRQGFGGNGGPALEATLSGPKGISAGPDGNIYFTDTESHTIRMLDTKSGRIEWIAGTGQRGDGPDGAALKCGLNRPHGIFVDSAGIIYVGDSENHKIRVIRHD